MINFEKIDYDFNALEPYIDEKTMEIHHTKHHQGYVNNLNNLLEGTELQDATLEEVLVKNLDLDLAVKAGINNNAGGAYLHNNFFGQFSGNVVALAGDLKDKVEEQFGTVEKMLEELKTKGATQFGSGWSALAVNTKTKELEIIQFANQNIAPFIAQGVYPIATIDVWEHAYYLNYQNLRPKYLEEVIKIIDWGIVEKRYKDLLA
ncbi:MAG: superoxide dismutase [Mycoplasmatales bacterium]